MNTKDIEYWLLIGIFVLVWLIGSGVLFSFLKWLTVKLLDFLIERT